VTCQVLREDGGMATLADLHALAGAEGLALVSVSDLLRYRLQHETLVRRAGEAKLPTRNAGTFRAIVYENEIDGIDHMAIVKGDVASGEPVLVRLHSECLTGDAFHSLRCDCGEQLDGAMERIEREGRGVILYLRQEGRGIGLKNKIRAYGLQDREGLDTVEANVQLGFAADQRDYGVGGQILVELGVRRLRLLTNNPRKQSAIEALGLEIVERVPLEITPNEKNLEYLRTKREKLGHELRFGEED
jgi:3,4-dihydroxy 2-butanone 4-phosphate synthase/GTP cyclohydrolase II